MASKTKRHRSGATQTTSANRASETKVPDHKIQIRAYEIYLGRGEQHGRDLEDWLQAEGELKANLTGE